MSYLSLLLLLFLIFIPLAMKWELDLKIVIPWTILVGLLGCLTIYCLNLVYPNIGMITTFSIGLVLALFLSGATLLILFFRDPERSPPDQERCILSPADGRVVYVKEIRGAEFPFAVKGRKKIPLYNFTSDEFLIDRGVQIGIGMTFFDVHVNRSPIKGEIKKVKHVPGKFHSLKKVSSLLENERVFILICKDEIELGVVQIASRLVRRIISYVKEGDFVKKGQRIGMIRFGSQVDILIPYRENLKVHIKPGDELRAGTSIVATY